MNVNILKKKILEFSNQIARGEVRSGYAGWSDDILNMLPDEITEFMKARLENARDHVEYYYCMVYLMGVIPSEQLFTYWEDSFSRKKLYHDSHLSGSRVNILKSGVSKVGIKPLGGL